MEVSTTTQATVSISESATAADGAAAPALDKVVAGVDNLGNAQALLTDTSGRLTPDPTLATGAKQDTGNTSLASIDGKATTGNASLSSIDTKLTSQATGAKQDTGNTSLASIDTKLTSQATAAKQDTGNTSLASVDGKLTTLNANLNPVTGATAQSDALSGAAVTANAPANAVGFIIQAPAANTDFISWACGATASAAIGMQLQPGQDSGFIGIGANISIFANSGSQGYRVQWISR